MRRGIWPAPQILVEEATIHRIALVKQEAWTFAINTLYGGITPEVYCLNEQSSSVSVHQGLMGTSNTVLLVQGRWQGLASVMSNFA